MAGFKVDGDRCVACGLCVRSCPADVLSVSDRQLQVEVSKCILCGMCIDTCPYGALSIEAELPADADPSSYAGVWVFAEQFQGKVLPVAAELLAIGKRLALQRQCDLTAVLFGRSVREEAQLLIHQGADRVLLCEHESLEHRQDEPYAATLHRLVREEKPEILLFGATGFGRSLAPRIAARLETGLTADCTMLEIDPETGLLQQTRPAFGGNLMATILCPYNRPQMATVRPGVMGALEPDPGRSGTILPVRWEPHVVPRIEQVGEVIMEAADSIADARIIVSAGRGIGSHKNMALVKRLAALLGGSVGVSRPLVDTGWSEYRHQIGQTGSAVAPKVLITCGISGAIQHLAGISGAETIIAINSDPEAPIFSVAHYRVVGDCVEILKKLIARLELRLGSKGDHEK